MVDFVSEPMLRSEEGLLPSDALARDVFAKSLMAKLVQLPPGSVVALQGGWGSGKTYVLARTFSVVNAPDDSAGPDLLGGFIRSPIWINPWQYGTPDLLTPLVLSLAGRVSERKRPNPAALRKAVETLIRSGVNFAQKAGMVYGTSTGDLVTAGLWTASAAATDKAFEGLFKSLEIEKAAQEEHSRDIDYVSKMGERFAELVDAVVDVEANGSDARLLICIDDLDRCLPDRQVALLEAFRFLVSNRARAVFLIAIDPTLARQAVEIRYRGGEFDPELYLDKMFHLRVDLPSLPPTMVSNLVRGRFDDRTLGSNEAVGNQIISTFGSIAKQFVELSPLAWKVPILRNPRVIERVINRLYLFAVAHDPACDLLEDDEVRARVLLTWIGIADRWPAVRDAFRSAGSEKYHKRWSGLVEHCLSGSVTGAAVIDVIKVTSHLKETMRDLTDFSNSNGMRDKILPDFLWRLEEALLQCGL